MNIDIDGIALRGTYRDSIPEDNNGTTATAVAHFANDGINRVTHFRFTYYGPNKKPYDFIMVLPSQKGVYGLGETTVDSYGNPVYPLYYITFIFDDDVAFYDSNNNNTNDINSNLLSRTISVDIREFEETTNGLGLTVPSYIKGYLTGNGYFTAYTSPTTAPMKLDHSVTGSFEYHADE
ncbi:hypothetical protein DFQ11_105161 [Winogradskyella epiphytica]|uniref:Uncharacterized protein n=1 Tax=Winogradskyella epiphytica TaxID=262005 RepID=A0A2V4WVM5_9FLAO|nr:hypothetical protein [Winogradskyella epiphytica]PYE80562.1 hypothetical protein DFQ11_105161 [Winogradskyella epiphytica]GGW68602.1 hypothetical protein GCM10008085_20550 [Winogradskyella epiphytica]